MQEKTILIAGCGDVGSTFGSLMATAGHKVIGLRRNINQLPQGIQGISADLLQYPQLQKQLTNIKRCDMLIYCASATTHTEEGYQQAYIEGLNNLLQCLSCTPKHLIFTSSSGVYHQNDHSDVDENSSCEPQRFSGKIMLKAEENARSKAIPATIVRFSGIYGPGRNFLINKVRQGEVSNQTPPLYTNRIHRDDCAGVLQHLTNRLFNGGPLEPCYLASDDCPASMYEVSHWLAEQLGIKPTQNSLNRRAGSKRCNNQRLKESGYQFIYPDYKSGYSSLLANKL